MHSHLDVTSRFLNLAGREMAFSEEQRSAVMSMPDALSMEIALIALLLFKLQVYSTSLHHYYHRPITLSMFQLSHQSTLHHMVLINTL
jgi:hypothetical protein